MTSTIEAVPHDTILPLTPAGSHAVAAASALARASSLLTPLGIPELPLPPVDVDGAKAAFKEAVDQLELGLKVASGLPGHAELEAALGEVREGLFHLQTPHIALPIVDVVEHAWKGGEMVRKALEMLEVGQPPAADAHLNPNTGIVPPWLKQRNFNGYPPFLEPTPQPTPPPTMQAAYLHFEADTEPVAPHPAAFGAGTPPMAWIADAHKWLNVAYIALDEADVDGTRGALATVMHRFEDLAGAFPEDPLAQTAQLLAARLNTAAQGIDQPEALTTFGEVMDALAVEMAAAGWDD